MKGRVYLLPSFLDEEALSSIPAYVTGAVKECQVFFVENERSARRYLKKLWKEMVIDDYEWFTIHKAEQEVISAFRQKLAEGKTIGIISEAGCPAIADPGQWLVAAAQEMKCIIRPFVGPSSILLALMASGLNGQQFRFHGYLPIDNQERARSIRELENESRKRNCTEIFIETPYRNNQLLDALLQHCQGNTLVCIAANLTGNDEWIRTNSVQEWKKEKPELHKRPVIFLLLAS